MVTMPLTNSISVYEKDFQLKVSGQKGILHPSEDLIRLVMRGKDFSERTKSLCVGFRCRRWPSHRIFDVVGLRCRRDGCRAVIHRSYAKTISMEIKDIEAFFLRTVPALPLSDGAVSLVVAWEVLHWLGSPETFQQAIREFLRVLVRGGTILLTMPTETHYLKRYSLEVGKSTYLCKTRTRMDCVFYSPNLFTLRHLFEEELGLKIQQTLRYEYGSTATESTLDERMSFYGVCLTRAN